MNRVRSFALVLAVLGLPSCARDDQAPQPVPEARPPIPDPAPRDDPPRGQSEPVATTTGQTIYVPAYSHVATSDGGRPFNLAITLAVRNTDRAHPITLSSVRYHDSAGRLVRALLAPPARLAPLAGREFFVKENDTSGGSSASFLVEWVADLPVTAPVVEAVMIGTASTQGISFTCPGRVIATRPRLEAATPLAPPTQPELPQP